MAEFIFDTSKIKPLKDVHRFRPAALHYEERGEYPQYPDGSMALKRHWDEEINRSLNGYTKHGDYIPGYFYFYLNYGRIQKLETREGRISVDGRVQADRVDGFPNYYDGDYEYFLYLDEAEKRGKHACVLKTRGVGFSYKGANMFNRNYFLIKGSNNFAIADDKKYLIEDGLLTKTWSMMNFIDGNTPWRKRRGFKNTDLHKRASYEEIHEGAKIETGYMSEVMGVSIHNNPDAARGRRGKLIEWEEAGACPNILIAWNVARQSVERGHATFGLMAAFGTGGVEGSGFLGLKEMFYNPRGYNILPCKNVWSKNAGPDSVCGFFVPAYKNMEGCMDKDGISDIPKAMEMIEHDRKVTAKETTDPNSLKRAIAELPLTPEEATLRITGTIFPVAALEDHLSHAETHPKDFRDNELIGRIRTDSETGELKWKPDSNLRPIYDFPLKDNKNLEGCIVIYEPPQSVGDGKIPWGMYIAGTDPYDDDESSTTSLGSTFIFNRFTDRIVAEYTGRPRTAKEYYEGVRKLLTFYNAVCCYENNYKGLFSYFENANCLYLLADTPQYLKDTELTKVVGYGNRAKGVRVNEAINRHGRELIKTWLLEIAVKATSGDILNIHKIRCIPLLKELIEWVPDLNADRISALSMVMILRESMIRISAEEEKDEPVIDEFFTRSELFKQNMNTSSPF